MTRRDYVTLADALRSAMPAHADLTDIGMCHRDQWKKDCKYVALALKTDNPKGFDRELFLDNCGVTK